MKIHESSLQIVPLFLIVATYSLASSVHVLKSLFPGQSLTYDFFINILKLTFSRESFSSKYFLGQTIRYCNNERDLLLRVGLDATYPTGEPALFSATEG